MFKYKKYILLTMLCGGMQNMCMAVPRGTREVSFAPEPIFIGAENEGDNWSTRAAPYETSEVLGDDTVDGLSTVTNVADRQRRLLPNALQPRQPSIPPLPVPAAVNFGHPFNAAFANGPFFGPLQFGPVPVPQPEDPMDRVIRELNEPATPKIDVFAGSDPKPHIEMMFETISVSLTEMDLKVCENNKQFLNTLGHYLHTHFMQEDKTSYDPDAKLISKREHYISSILERMKIVFDHGNDAEVQQALFILSSIIQTADNPTDIHNATMNVSDYMNKLKALAHPIQLLILKTTTTKIFNLDMYTSIRNFV